MDKREALRTFMTGENFHLQHYLGAHWEEVNGEYGYTFRVWAPNAQAVHLVGDFTNWVENQIPMERNEFGVWEVFTSLAQESQIYKYHITRANGHQLMKIDPLAVRYEARPGTGAILTEIPEKKWKDGLWLARRKRLSFEERPVNIYEAHAGSWKRNPDGSPYSFAQLKDELIPYLVEMNYTHIEFMPLMSHPLGLSWGYQLMGYFALEHAYGRPEEFQDFVEECHLNNIGVIVDWVPGHFTINDDALAYYDGTPTFEYQDHNKAHNYGWGALNFDLGKNEVQSFLISSIKFWIDFYHLDGIRVDAVSNMLYLDYDDAPWTPNKDGGNLNYEGYYFLQRLNDVIKQAHPDVMMIAEESSSATQITDTKDSDGIGFDYKWNMGWMNDTLRYMMEDPINRKYHHNKMTFGMMYQYSENFVLPLSHDEVVHGKRSLLGRMPGDCWQQFANLRAYYGFMYGFPGKKLLFMGSEFAQGREWNYNEGLDWFLLEQEGGWHKGVQDFVRELNHVYKDTAPLYQLDQWPEGFEWLVADDGNNSVFVFERRDREGNRVIVISNFTPVVREGYRFGVNSAGEYREILNSDDLHYKGSGVSAGATVETEEVWSHGKPNSLSVTVPPLATVYLYQAAVKEEA